MKLPLKKHIIAATGDFGEARSHDNLRRWVENNGGKWVSTVTKDCTHLICSKDHWKRLVSTVKAARQNKKTLIVCYDWLEDSLQSRNRKREGPYLWKNREKQDAEIRAARREAERKALKKDAQIFDDGCEASRTDLMSGLWTPKTQTTSKLSSLSRSPSNSASANLTRIREQRIQAVNDPHSGFRRASTSLSPTPLLPLRVDGEGEKEKKQRGAKSSSDADVWRRLDNHHVYRDENGFDFDVRLTRVDNRANSNERFTIRLYESHTVPHTYATFTRFVPPKGAHITATLAPIGSTFEVAFKHVRRLFEEKTRVTWEERLSKDAFAQAANMAKQAMTIKYQIAEAEEREVTAEMKKEWEKETRLYTWRKDGEVVARRLSPKNELPLKAEKA